MVGIGSGNWTRRDKKAVCEAENKIDIYTLNQHGALTPGSSGVIRWESNGRDRASINFSVDQQCLMLNLGGTSAVQTIRFDWTECYYGGKRTWFLCPECNTRVATVYSGSNGFACRQCNDLKYASQNESGLDRQYRKIRKLRRVLGGSDNLTKPLWLRPKGMHRKTFARMLETEKSMRLRLQIEMLTQFNR